jgi:hypothetical protein
MVGSLEMLMRDSVNGNRPAPLGEIATFVLDKPQVAVYYMTYCGHLEYVTGASPRSDLETLREFLCGERLGDRE